MASHAATHNITTTTPSDMQGYPPVDFTSNHELLNDSLAHNTPQQQQQQQARNPLHSHPSRATYGWGIDDTDQTLNKSRTVSDCLSDTYLRYELQFCTYMLQPWEKKVFNGFLATVTAASTYVACKAVYAVLDTIPS